MSHDTAADRPIRVLVDGTGWLADAVRRSLGDQPDMQLVDGGSSPAPRAKRGNRVDVVVTSLHNATVHWKHRTGFFTDSGVPLLAISEDGTRVEVYDRWLIPEVGLATLAAAIRDVARHQQVADVPSPID
jgi:hypothetical protein